MWQKYTGLNRTESRISWFMACTYSLFRLFESKGLLTKQRDLFQLTVKSRAYKGLGGYIFTLQIQFWVKKGGIGLFWNWKICFIFVQSPIFQKKVYEMFESFTKFTGTLSKLLYFNFSFLQLLVKNLKKKLSRHVFFFK